MAILVSRRSRVITQGTNGEAGLSHTGACRRYGKGKRCFVADVNARLAGEVLDGLPTFGTVQEARARTGATVSLVSGPPVLAAAAIEEAIEAGIELVVCIAEGIPLHDMIRVRRRLQGGRTLLLGDDLGTDAVLMVGDSHNDSDGDADEDCARWIAEHMRKPVVGLVAGDDDGARQAFAAMHEHGIPVTRDPAMMGELVAAVVAPQWLPFD